MQHDGHAACALRSLNRGKESLRAELEAAKGIPCDVTLPRLRASTENLFRCVSVRNHPACVAGADRRDIALDMEAVLAVEVPPAAPTVKHGCILNPILGAAVKASRPARAEQGGMMMRQQPPLFVRPTQIKEMFGIHCATLYWWAAAGHVRIHKRGAAIFVSVSEISTFITGGLGDQLEDPMLLEAKRPLTSR